MDNRRVVFTGPFTEQSGYSNLNRGFVLNLDKRGYSMGIENVKCPMELTPEEFAPYKKFIKAGVRPECLFLETSNIKIISWIPLRNVPPTHCRILYTMAESKNIHPGWITTANLFYDEIWVPTKYYAEKFIEGGLKRPVFVVPIGVDDIYNKNNVKKDFKINYKVYSKREDAPKNPEGFKFLTVSRWGKRKGFDVMLRAFLKNFTYKDNVSLCLIARHAASRSEICFTEAVKEQLQEEINNNATNDSPPVYLCTDIILQEDMPTVYSKHDAFVSCSRGEGQSLCPLEATVMGLPCLCPNHTGFSDYISEETALTFDVDEWEVWNRTKYGRWVTNSYEGQEFPVFGEKTIAEVGNLMIQMKSDSLGNEKRIGKMQKIIAERYTWEKCIDKAEERIKKYL